MIVESQVNSGKDDAEELLRSGKIDLSSSDLELVKEDSTQTVGMRFIVNIPQGANITNAYIQFTADETHSGDTTLTIEGEDTGNSLEFQNVDWNISSRLRTTESISWSPAPWDARGEAGLDQQTPDISLIIQEIVRNPGWVANNWLAIIITGDGKRVAESYNGSSLEAPKLHVEYTAGPVPEICDNAVDDDGDSQIDCDDPDCSGYPACALQQAIDDEVAARTAGDTAEHQHHIDGDAAEAAVRQAADHNLQLQLDNEAAARASDDATLQSNIDAEEAARIAEDNALQLHINDLSDRVEILETAPNSKVLEGSFTITSHADIEWFCPQYEEITGSLIIHRNTGLTNLNGLGCLRRIGGGIFISVNSNLTDISGLGNVQSIGRALDPFSPGGSTEEYSIKINSNLQLQGLLPFHSISEVPGTVFLSDLPGLWGMSGLTHIGGKLVIGNVQSLVGLENLISIDGDFEVFFTSSLVDFTGLLNLKYIGGSLDIVENDVLTSIAPIFGVSIRQGIFIFNNPLLSTLEGFDPIKVDDGVPMERIRIRNNNSLISLDGLETYSEGELNVIEIDQNESLSSVSALRNITSLNGSFIITNNPFLPTVGEAEALRDAIGVENIRGTITISGNGPG
jgi:hypothetical protein